MDPVESKAIIVTGQNHQDFSVETIKVSAPSSGECRVKMTYASYSPYDTIHESKINGVTYPFLCGYDGVGVVESTGEDVTDLTVGDFVAVFLVP